MTGDAKIWSKAETAEDLRKRCPTSVEFLREMACIDFCLRYQERFAEAANEIERLRADRQALMDATDQTAKIVLGTGKQVTDLEDEVERLELKNAGLWDRLDLAERVVAACVIVNQIRVLPLEIMQYVHRWQEHKEAAEAARKGE